MCSQLNCYKWMPARQLCFSRRGRYQAGSASRTTGALKAPASLYNWLNKGEVKRLPKLESLSDHTSQKGSATAKPDYLPAFTPKPAIQMSSTG